MSRNLIASALLFTGLCAAGVAQAAAPAAKISMAHARTIALKTAPGKVISAEYENEGGGWRYSFDIQQKGNVQEIGVDGKTGKIVENKSEGKVDRD
ncbi:MAG TPA: PepSY domain-containing protein [Sphingomicrobium sp.]|nr:PepSY domain-containing protein [Sphingomicrobium sp.]